MDPIAAGMTATAFVGLIVSIRHFIYLGVSFIVISITKSMDTLSGFYLCEWLDRIHARITSEFDCINRWRVARSRACPRPRIFEARLERCCDCAWRWQDELHELVQHFVGRLEIEKVDIVDFAQITALRERLKGRSFDLLFVNAGIANGPEETISGVTTEAFVRVMVTNTLGPMRVVETLGDLVQPGGTIGVMSSRLGSVAANDTGGWEIYRGSKAAMNTLMRSYAVRHRDDPRTLLLIAPGWVRTDMGGPKAALSIEESIPRVVDTISAASGKRGSIFSIIAASPFPGKRRAAFQRISRS